MTQYEFVRELELALRGNVSDQVIRENVEYYRSYIREQVAAGRTESEILAELGSPRLIARTIIDTAGTQADADGDGSGTESKSSWSFTWLQDSFRSSWVVKTVVILAVLFVIFLVLSLVFKIVGILFKPAIVVLAIFAVCYAVKNWLKK